MTILIYKKKENLELTAKYLSKPYAFNEENDFACEVADHDAYLLINENPLMFDVDDSDNADIKVDFLELDGTDLDTDDPEEDQDNSKDNGEGENDSPEEGSDNDTDSDSGDNPEEDQSDNPDNCKTVEEAIEKVKAMTSNQCDAYANELNMDPFKSRVSVGDKRDAIIAKMMELVQADSTGE